jgi:hypothetical protein
MGQCLKFPARRNDAVVVTGLMKSVMSRTVNTQPLGGLVVWSGATRLGKTTTARLLAEEINSAYDPKNPDAFRAHYYEVGKIADWAAQGDKKAVRSLYHAVAGPLDEGLYRQSPSEDLASLLVRNLKRQAIGLILVDEAGLLSIEAMRGMVLVRDVAENMGVPLGLVFVGMDDLPTKLTRNPQVEGRIHEWCHFSEYDFDETWDLLRELHPHFRTLDRTDPDHRAQVDFIHDTFGGVPGRFVPFLHKVDSRLEARSLSE